MLERLLNTRRTYKRLKRKVEAERLALMIDREGIDLFLDVGGNTGQTATSLRRHGYAGSIISFEPVRHCHEALLRASKSDPDWHVFERCALGNETGDIEILVSEASDLSSVSPPTPAMLKALPKATAICKETVPIHRLDDIMRDQIAGARSTFLKIDAQGHDLAVIKGASGVMDRLKGIQVEMSLLPLYVGEASYLDVLKVLHRNGYVARSLVDRAYSKDLGRQLQVEGVFFLDERALSCARRGDSLNVTRSRKREQRHNLTNSVNGSQPPDGLSTN